jgi:hypothetical protein
MSESQPEPRRTTEVFDAAERARVEAAMLRQQGIGNAPLTDSAGDPIEPPTPHVLDRRVMVTWASLTFVVYILIRLIIGPVKDAVVDAVRAEIENQAAPVTNTAIPPIPPVPPTAVEPATPPATTAPEAPASTDKRVRIRIQR